MRGEIRAGFARLGARTETSDLFETGGYRLRMPRTHGSHCDAVIVNTGGGVAGGDTLALGFTAAAGSSVTVTTTAAEKVYRADDEAAEISVRLEAGPEADLAWVPQETILFDGAKLRRRLDAEVADGSTLLVAEMLVFGRLAMGETMRRGAVRDRWRVRRGRRLVFAEDLRLDDDIAALLDRPALGAGARASATVLFLAADAEARLDAVRGCLDAPECTAGASAWEGKLVVRALSVSPERLRSVMVRVLTVLRGCPLPRTWS